MTRTLPPGADGEPVHVFKCEYCKVHYITEDDYIIAGAQKPGGGSLPKQS